MSLTCFLHTEQQPGETTTLLCAARLDTMSTWTEREQSMAGVQVPSPAAQCRYRPLARNSTGAGGLGWPLFFQGLANIWRGLPKLSFVGDHDMGRTGLDRAKASGSQGSMAAADDRQHWPDRTVQRPGYMRHHTRRYQPSRPLSLSVALITR